MKTHYCPQGFPDDAEFAPCGTLFGKASNVSRDWDRVDCGHCQHQKIRIMGGAHADLTIQRGLTEIDETKEFSRLQIEKAAEFSTNKNYVGPIRTQHLKRYLTRLATSYAVSILYDRFNSTYTFRKILEG